jgi:GT2 family glycosyltransferase
VIVVAYRPGRRLFDCLESLARQGTEGPFETIVVDSSGDGTAERVRRSFPEVAVVRSPRRLYPGQARNVGLEVGHAPIVAFVDSDCTVEPGWLQGHLDEHARGDARIVGGPVANGQPGSRVATAAWLCEFRMWVPEQPRAYVDDFPTCNISYAREVIDEAGGFAEVAYGSDTELHWRTARLGERIMFSPAPVARHHSIERLGRYLHHELRHGHDYARVRCGHHGWSRARRAAYAALWPVLPAVIFARSRSALRECVQADRRARGTAPLLLAGWTAWSLGEAVGYARGGDPRLETNPREATPSARPPADAPRLSVVVETLSDTGDRLVRVLDELAAQDYPDDRLEVVVPTAPTTGDAVRAIAAGRPGVRTVDVDGSDYYPMKRRAGLAATGDVVAFIDSDCLPSRDWAAAIAHAIAGGADATVGPTRYAGDGAKVDLASYFAFGHIHDDGAGTATGVPANNFAVRREVFQRHPWDDRLARTGGCQLMFHALRAGGRRIAFSPRQRVDHAYDTSDFVLQRARSGFDAIALPRLDPSGGLADARFAQLGVLAPLGVAAARVARDLLRLAARRQEPRLPARRVLLAVVTSPAVRAWECLGGWLALAAPRLARRTLRW